MAVVRYIVDDVAAVPEFYVSNLGFEIKLEAAPAINILGLGAPPGLGKVPSSIG